MTKDERQEIGIYTYLKAGAIGTLDYIMRFGKTRTAIKIIERFRVKYVNDLIVIVVPSLSIKEMWISELNNTYNLVNIEVYTSQELLNLTVDNRIICRLFIVDEIHKFTTPERIKLLNKTRVTYVFNLGLTGSYDYANKTLNEYFPVVDTITEKEALDNKWISNFREYNIPLELSDSDKKDYIKYSKIIYEALSNFKGLHGILKFPDGKPFFSSDLDLILSCYSGKKILGYDYIKSKYIRESVALKMDWKPNLDLSNEYNKDRDEYWNPDNIKKTATKFHKAMQARNELHNINEVKLQAVLELYAYYKHRTIITFNGSTTFADMITDAINNTFKCDKAISYYANSKGKPLMNFVDGKYFLDAKGNIKSFGVKRQLDYIVEMLKIGKYNIVNAVNALDEGFSVENIDIVITTSGSTNPTTYNQRSARGKTIDSYNPNKLTLIFNLYFDDFNYMIDGEYKWFKSRDASKIRLRQENRYVPITTLSEILKK